MAIQDVGSMNKFLNTTNTRDWVKSANIESSDLEMLGVQQNSEVKGRSFSEMLATSIADVNKLQQEANTAVQKLASGESKNIHETMIISEKADIAFRMMNQIRSKVIDAYREIMRMQI